MKIKSFVAIACAILLSSIVLRAQEKKHLYYVEIYEVSTLGTKSVSLDFGKDAPMGMVYKITDEEGNNINFKNSVAALNYLSQKGWELVSVFDVNKGKAGVLTVFLLKYDAAVHGKCRMTEAIDEVVKEYL